MGEVGLGESSDNTNWELIWYKTGDQGSAWGITCISGDYGRYLKFTYYSGESYTGDFALDYIQVISKMDTFTITAPGSGDTFDVGDKITITWEIEGEAGDTVHLYVCTCTSESTTCASNGDCSYWFATYTSYMSMYQTSSSSMFPASSDYFICIVDSEEVYGYSYGKTLETCQLFVYRHLR